ncbi:MAG: uridine kinase [Bacilli bacterium]|nr:uridine kinase [Mollicutes bacterium]MDY3899368.1 uridine kinase [Bacilli bacterium]
MKPTIIGIAGGTASGKTTIAKKIYEQTKSYGTITLIRMDDYYKTFPNIPVDERGNKNFDHPDSYDTPLLVSDLKKLQQGLPIEKPIYDFVVSNRSNKTETIYPGDVIILEGIMTFTIPEIRDCLDIKIFVDTPDDIRFIRRLERDLVDRKRSLDSIINQYLNSVRPMHHAFVEPSKVFADLIIPEGGHNMIALDFIVTKINNLLTHQK